MLINQDYMQVMRRGKWVESINKPKQPNTWLITLCLPLTLTAFLVILTLSLAYSEPIGNNYTDNQIVNAIYKAEGGSKTKHPFGILSVKCTGYDECRQICLNTVRNNRKRFANQSKVKDFIVFLGNRYCPVNAENDNGTNKYWIKNVKHFLIKGE